MLVVHVVASFQGQSIFCKTTVLELQDVKIPQFSHFWLFSPCKTPKSTFLGVAYSPGATLQNTSGYSTLYRSFVLNKKIMSGVSKCGVSVTSVRGAGDPQICPNFRLREMPVYTYTMHMHAARLIWANKCSKTRHSA